MRAGGKARRFVRFRSAAGGEKIIATMDGRGRGRTSPSSEAWAGEAAATVTAATAAAFSTVERRWGGTGRVGSATGTVVRA